MKVELPSVETVDRVCHELRKPVAVIQAYAELLADEIAGPVNEKQRSHLETVAHNVQRLDRLIGNLFECFRVASIPPAPAAGPVDLERLCHELVEELEPICGRRKCRLSVRSDGELFHPGLDVERLRSALTRLLDNALRFASEGETLVLSLARRNGCARFELGDPGPRLSHDEAARVFDLFFRPERDLLAPSGAGGAELGVCRILVESLGGRVRAESRAGPGTTYVLELPLGETAG